MSVQRQMREQQALEFARDRATEIDHQIMLLLHGPQGDAARPWPLDADARRLLEVLRWHKGERQAVTIAELARRLDLSDRDVKAAARELVVSFGVPIVGSRRERYGYYIAITADEIEEGARPLRNEIVQLARRYRALTSRQRLEEFLGQVPLLLETENDSPQRTQRNTEW